jgi:TonB-dependent starch-binding outer membrane protein SusC
MQIMVCKRVLLLCGISNKGAKPKQCLSALTGTTKTLQQAVRIMKLIAVLLLGACMHVHATGYGQKISLSERDVPLEKVFKKIQEQTKYKFLYTSQLLEGVPKVTISVKNASLEEVLDLVFKDQKLDYEINENTIVVRPKVKAKGTLSQEETPADPIEVRGVIIDENGAPAQGVNVMVKGTSKGTTTNLRGEFVISGVDENAILLVTSVGYDRQEILVKNKTFINTQLRVAVGNLDEVQMIAYGTTSKRFQTGNVATVKASDIEKQPVQNPLLALQGRVPGLFIVQNNGLPGGGVTVRVQGQNSIGNGNDPFYVIDGTPYYSQLPATGPDEVLGFSGQYGANGNPLNYINPSDIESIEVLKDADATAIYGSRAANGAILITTKKGKAGAAKIDINFRQGAAKVTRLWEMMNTQQYLTMRNEALNNDGLAPGPSDFDLTFWDTTRYTNWQKSLIGGSARYTDVNASISGGTSNIQYLVGGTFHRETSVFPGDFSNQKGASHFNFTATSNNEKFRVVFSGNYMLDVNKLPLVGDLVTKAYLLEPNAPPLYNSDGTLNWAQTSSGYSTFINPISYIYNRYRNKTSNLVGNTVLSYRILPGLEVKSSFGYTNTQTNDFNASPSIAIRPEDRASEQNYARYGNRNLNSWIIEPLLSYNREMGRGKLDLLAGSTIQQSNANGGYIIGLGYNNDQQLENIASATSFFVGSSFITQYKYAALFGKLNYNWLNKYILNLAGRRDGSSRFGVVNQFHNFWSIGGAWLFSQEQWMKNFHFLSFGKLRSSYGTSGSDQIGDYQFLSTYNTVGSGGRPYQNSTGLAPTGLPNPYLQWEETRKFQGGIELGFMHDRIYVNVTYALNRCSNQLLNTVLPSFVGFSSIAANFPATVQNTSCEFSLQTSNIKNETFQWITNATLTIPRNKLVAFPDFDKSPYTKSLIIGQPVNVMRELHYIGVDPATGIYQVADANGSPTLSPSYPSDYTVLISTFPKYYGGLQNSIKYKGVQLDFFFYWVKQNGTNYSFSGGPGGLFPGEFYRGYSNQPTSAIDRWQKPGDQASVQYYSTTAPGSSYNLFYSDHFYADASFIRLKNASISWQLPAKWKKSAHLRNALIYVQGQNLLTLTSYKGPDPENQSNSSLPPLRVWTIGFQVEL